MDRRRRRDRVCTSTHSRSSSGKVPYLIGARQWVLLMVGRELGIGWSRRLLPLTLLPRANFSTAGNDYSTVPNYQVLTSGT